VKGFITVKAPLNESHLQSGRSWFTKPERLKLRIVYHDAKAGKHLDIHFSNGVSFIVKVSGKPVESKIKYNKDGELTKKSMEALIDHFKSEISNNARVPQNLDHTWEEAQRSWLKGECTYEGYGQGLYRGTVLETEVEVLIKGDKVGETTLLYAPAINHDLQIYFHKLYYGDNKKAPIAIIGRRTGPIPSFLEKPKLKKVLHTDKAKFIKDTDSTTWTIKEDGAACHIYSDTHGTRVFSPREGKRTGRKIEYTGKIPKLAHITSSTKVKAMGEFMVSKDGIMLNSNEIAGVLRDHCVVPPEYDVDIVMYRVDSMGKEDCTKMTFFENRSCVQAYSEMLGVSMTEIATIEDCETKGWEGLVGVIKGGSLWKGAYKLKYRDNYFDWKITGVDFKLGPSSTPKSPKIAGVVNCVSEESGKEFFLGPGQVSDRETCLDMMNNPDKYIGRVVRVACLRGHPGRSAKVIDFHLDKGKE